jgi:hypothetical protein
VCYKEKRVIGLRVIVYKGKRKRAVQRVKHGTKTCQGGDDPEHMGLLDDDAASWLPAFHYYRLLQNGKCAFQKTEKKNNTPDIGPLLVRQI